MKIRSIAKKKVSDFLLGEAGQVGRRGTFTVAALASASGLAAFLVDTPTASAVVCGNEPDCCGANAYCCTIEIEEINLGPLDFCSFNGDATNPPWVFCQYIGPCC